MTTPVPFTCNADEARILTEDIRRGVEKVHTLLVRSYEWKAWQALGYVSWRDYATSEFGISKSHAYRLLDQARVIREIEAVADSPIGELDEGPARELAPIVRDHGPEAAAAVLAAVVESGKPTAAAIRSEAQAQGVAKVTQTTRTTEATKVERLVDMETGEVLGETVTDEQWEAEHPEVTPSPEVRQWEAETAATMRAANLRHGFAKWLVHLGDVRLFDPAEMGDIYPDRVDDLARTVVAINDFMTAYRATTDTNRRLHIVKEA